MKEIWRDIKDYEGMYQVSNLGRVRSLNRIDSIGRKISGRIFKPSYVGRGYLQIYFRIGGKRKAFRVHQLVAQAFIPNPDNKTQVNHLDEDKTNNNIENLEWTTAKENNNYGTHNQKVAKSLSKPIKVIYQDGTYEFWDSTTAFAREFGISGSNVSDVLRGRYKSSHGMKFEYA